jgi:hypothetical protein
MNKPLEIPLEPTMLEHCNRIEVIDAKGRSYVNWKKFNQIEVSLQDDGRTLKIFVTENDG